MSDYEVNLLIDHAGYGCWSVIAIISGKRYPFVFQIRTKRRFIRYAYLIYCRDMQSFLNYAAPLGRYLAKRGVFIVMIDANGPITGLRGKYQKATPKYYKGPVRPKLGDESYTERVLFNIG